MNESREQQLQAILHDYLQAVDRGETPDRQKVIDAHPELCDEIAEFFADASKLEHMARSLKTVSLGGGTGDASPSIGKVRYFGDYELIEEIARGGMGVVFRAKQVSLNRVVALKMILKGELASEADVRRFRQEAEAAANLDHPNIVPIYEVGEHEGQQYFTMKLIPVGPGVEQEVSSKERQRRVAETVAKVARAVHHAHQRGILHRDLKPSNILIDTNGEPHVADFGLSRKIDRGDNATKSGAIIGTPAYMSPEQSRAESSLTTAVDVWSLGVILYEGLTGQTPFGGGDVVSTLMKVAMEDPVPPRRVNAAIDCDLDTICLKCLQKEPARRYASAQAIADELDRWLKGELIEARPVGIIERTWRWSKRNPLSAVVILAAVTLFSVLVGGKIHSEMDARARQLEMDHSELRETRHQASDSFQRHNDIIGMVWLTRALELANRLEQHDAAMTVRNEMNEASKRIPVLRVVLFGEKTTRRSGYAEINIRSNVALSTDARFAALTLDKSGSGVRLGVFDLATGKRLAAIDAAVNPAVAFSPDSKQLLVGLPQAGLRLYEIPSMKLLKSATTIAHPPGVEPQQVMDKIHGIDRVGFSPDGKSCFSLMINPGMWCQLWDRETLTPISECHPEENGLTQVIRDLDFSPDGKTVAIGTDYGIRLFDIETGKHASPLMQLGMVKGENGDPVIWKKIESLAFHPDGKSIFGIGETLFGEWNVVTGKSLGRIKLPAAADFFRLSPDGTRLLTFTLAAIHQDYTCLWDTSTGERLDFSIDFKEIIQQVDFHPDGQGLLWLANDDFPFGMKIQWIPTAAGHPLGNPQVIPRTWNVVVPVRHRDQKEAILAKGLETNSIVSRQGVVLSKDRKALLDVQTGEARLWEIIQPDGLRESVIPAFPKDGSVEDIRSWIAAFTGIGIGRPEGAAEYLLWNQPYTLDQETWSAARTRWAPER